MDELFQHTIGPISCLPNAIWIFIWYEYWSCLIKTWFKFRNSCLGPISARHCSSHDWIITETEALEVFFEAASLTKRKAMRSKDNVVTIYWCSAWTVYPLCTYQSYTCTYTARLCYVIRNQYCLSLRWFDCSNSNRYKNKTGCTHIFSLLFFLIYIGKLRMQISRGRFAFHFQRIKIQNPINESWGKPGKREKKKEKKKAHKDY